LAKVEGNKVEYLNTMIFRPELSGWMCIWHVCTHIDSLWWNFYPHGWCVPLVMQA